MRFAVLSVLVVGSVVAAPVPKELRKTDDAKAVLGTWKAHALSVNGRPEQVIATHTFRLEPDGRSHTLFGDGQRSDWTYTLDPTTTPKRMTWVGAGTGNNVTFQCVFEVSGDTMKLGFIGNGKTAPAKVEPGPDLTLYEMKRVK